MILSFLYLRLEQVALCVQARHLLFHLVYFCFHGLGLLLQGRGSGLLHLLMPLLVLFCTLYLLNMLCKSLF